MGASGGMLVGWNDEVVSCIASQVGTFSVSILFSEVKTSFVWLLFSVYDLNGCALSESF